MNVLFHLNGSDTDWLVYADYLEDQGIDATHIREGVIEPQTNSWNFDFKIFIGVGSSTGIQPIEKPGTEESTVGGVGGMAQMGVVGTGLTATMWVGGECGGLGGLGDVGGQ